MAVVAHTPYSGITDCKRTNEYLTDGHGIASGRTNRYLTDGHGGTTLCAGYNCPADPQLATEYMATLRLNYERQHPPSEGRTKGSLTHVQFYVSPTAEDNVPPEERMQMMKELIERTPLRDYASIYVPHDNTPDKHGHISLCPYALDGTHKLPLNNSLLNDLRREMDYICVEHGYSIIDNPDLRTDNEYREWFFRIRDEGVITIHPQKPPEKGRSGSKRARNYAASKKAQAERATAQDAFLKRMTAGYSPESAEYFYTHPYLRDPADISKEIRIKRHDKDGTELSSLDLDAVSLFAWAYKADQTLRKKDIKGSQGLQRRFHALANKAWNAHQLITDLDIRTREELVAHIKEVGGDIAELKIDIKRQQTIIERSQGKELERAQARLTKDEALLADRSAEYRHLKEAESVLHPAEGKDLWREYQEQALVKDIAKKLEYADLKDIHAQLYELGKIAGYTKPEMDRLISKASASTWTEMREFQKIVYTRDPDGTISAIYEQIDELYEELSELRSAARIPVIGPITLLLSLTLAIAAGIADVITKREIEELKYEAWVEAQYERASRRDKVERMQEAKAIYEAEVKDASEAEIQAARARFLRSAASIVERVDILIEMDNALTLGEKIEAAQQGLKDGPPVHPNESDWRVI